MTTRRERAALQSASDRKRHQRPPGLPPCPSQALALKRACGHQQAVLIKCHSPLCPECEKERAARIQARWLPTLAWLPNLKLMTLTIENGHDLAERITTLNESYRRLLDVRLGRNNRKQIRRKVGALVARHLSMGKLDQADADKAIASTERWLKMAEQFESKHGKSPKLRSLIKGIANLETTHNNDTGTWHTHLHCIVSMPFMPHFVLRVLWTEATQHAGKIVDIRKVNNPEDGLREVGKYVTKAWEIPTEKYGEVMAALKGVKRVRRIGNIKPVEEEKQVCPNCNKPSCECGTTFVARADSSQAIIPNVVYKTTVYDMGMSYEGLLTITKDIHGHQVWSITSLAEHEVLSTYLHSVSRKGESPPTRGAPLTTAEPSEVVISFNEVKK